MDKNDIDRVIVAIIAAAVITRRAKITPELAVDDYMDVRTHMLNKGIIGQHQQSAPDQ